MGPGGRAATYLGCHFVDEQRAAAAAFGALATSLRGGFVNGDARTSRGVQDRRSVVEAGDGDNGRVVLVCEVAQDVRVPSQKGA